MESTDYKKIESKINKLFLEHGIGYQHHSGKIIKQSNSLTHTEIVTPATKLLFDHRFNGANEEFLKAHENYRHERYPECLVECLKSFESTMKIICTLKKWEHSTQATAKSLIDVCLKNKLIPTFNQEQLTSLRVLLESGIPTVRNNLAGHGQGADRRQLSPSFARYGLHLTAAAILLLVESFLEGEQSS